MKVDKWSLVAWLLVWFVLIFLVVGLIVLAGRPESDKGWKYLDDPKEFDKGTNWQQDSEDKYHLILLK